MLYEDKPGKETATLFAKESRRGRKSHRKPPASIPTNRRPVEYHCSKSQHGSIRLLCTKSTHPSDTPAMCVPPTRSLSAIDHAAEVLESELESDRSVVKGYRKSWQMPRQSDSARGWVAMIRVV